jgi:hypothetical protein
MEHFDKFDEEACIRPLSETSCISFENPTNPLEAKPKCLHENTLASEDKITCSDCGTVVSDNNICYDKDWKFQTGGVGKKNGTRCSQRKVDIKNISADILKLNISPELKARANDLFNITTKGSIFRGAKIFSPLKTTGMQSQTHSRSIVSPQTV